MGTQDLGAATDATVQLGKGSKGMSALVFGSGCEGHSARMTWRIRWRCRAPSKGTITGLQETSARQRFVGGFVEGLAERGPWSGAASVRVDSAQNLDTQT